MNNYLSAILLLLTALFASAWIYTGIWLAAEAGGWAAVFGWVMLAIALVSFIVVLAESM